jgi:hypothetical protein
MKIFNTKSTILKFNKVFFSTVKSLPSKFTDFFLPNANYHNIDRTQLIAKLLENNNTELVLRPENFGKSFNLEMLRFFLQSSRYLNETIDGTRCLEFFKKTEIYKNKPFFDTYFAKYPVVALNFEQLDEATFKDNIEKFKHLLKTHFNQLQYYDMSDNESIERTLKDCDDNSSIFLTNDLCRLLSKQTRQHPYLLIDSYDAPLLNAYKRGFYTEMLTFVESFFSNVVRNNSLISKVVITGVHKLESERLFHPLNNLNIYSSLNNNDKYNEFFGINEREVSELYDNAQQPIVKDYSSIKRNILTRFTFYNYHNSHEGYIKYLSHKLNLGNLFDKAITTDNNISLIKTLALVELRSQELLENIHRQYNEIKPEKEVNLSDITKSSILTYLYDNGLINKDGSITNKLSAEVLLQALPNIKDSDYDLNKKLAFGYYRYFYNNQIEDYLKYIQYIFKTSKDIPMFKENTDLDKYIIDKLTFEMDNPNSKDNVEIYEVDDNEFMTIGDELKKFTLITYERLRLALFIRGHRYKANTPRAKTSEADLKVTELFNNPNIDEKVKRPLIKKVNKKTLDYQLKKINEANLSSFDKNEAIEYLVKLSGDYDTVYFISISNYQRYIDYAIEASNLEKL